MITRLEAWAHWTLQDRDPNLHPDDVQMAKDVQALAAELQLARAVVEAARKCLRATGFFDGTFFSEARQQLDRELKAYDARSAK